MDGNEWQKNLPPSLICLNSPFLQRNWLKLERIHFVFFCSQLSRLNDLDTGENEEKSEVQKNRYSHKKGWINRERSRYILCLFCVPSAWSLCIKMFSARLRNSCPADCLFSFGTFNLQKFHSNSKKKYPQKFSLKQNRKKTFFFRIFEKPFAYWNYSNISENPQILCKWRKKM